MHRVHGQGLRIVRDVGMWFPQGDQSDKNDERTKGMAVGLAYIRNKYFSDRWEHSYNTDIGYKICVGNAVLSTGAQIFSWI